MALFNALVVEPDLEWEFIDGSIVKAHHTVMVLARARNGYREIGGE